MFEVLILNMSLGMADKGTASGHQIYFLFIFNIEKVKIRITEQTQTKVHRRSHYPKNVFPVFY